MQETSRLYFTLDGEKWQNAGSKRVLRCAKCVIVDKKHFHIADELVRDDRKTVAAERDGFRIDGVDFFLRYNPSENYFFPDAEKEEEVLEVEVENGEVLEFKKPEFDLLFISYCEKTKFIRGVIKSEHGMLFETWNINGTTGTRSSIHSLDYSLTPIQKEKPWYKNSENFPSIIMSANGTLITVKNLSDFCLHESILGELKLATSEDIQKYHYEGKDS